MLRPSRLLSFVVLMVASFVAYWPAMRNSFVWDDTALVLRDPLIRHWRLVPTGFKEFLFLDATASNFYRPLQRLTFTADYALWGIEKAPGRGQDTAAPSSGDSHDMQATLTAAQPGWHFTSVLCHALAAFALWRLLRAWFGDGWAPLIAALAWAVHPLHTSAVTYIAGRADPLAGLFAFTALALVAGAHAKGGLMAGDRKASQAIIWASLCAFCALLSKESGVAALTLWAVWIAFKARTNRRAWLAWGCAVVVCLSAYITLRSAADQTPVPPSTKESPLVMRPVLAARALAEYAALFVAPHSLHMERDVSIKPGDDAATVRFRHIQTAAGALIALGLILWARWASRRAPDAALALACFVITWLPISNLFKLNATVAEHWLYVPSAFLLAAILATVCRPREGAFSLRIPAIIAAAWIAFLGVQTWFQQDYWRDQPTFVKETAQRAGYGPRMLVNLGLLAASEGKPECAMDYYRQALAIDPKLEVAHMNLANAAIKRGDIPTALAELKFVENSPLFAADVLLIRAGLEESGSGRPQVHLLARAITEAPRKWDVCKRYPEKLAAMGRLDDAFKDLLAQIDARPYRSESYLLLGKILEGMATNAANARNRKEFDRLLGLAARAYGDAANRDCRDEVSRSKLAEFRRIYSL